MDVGVLDIVYPEDDELVEVTGWGRAPVDHLWVFLADETDRAAAEGIAASLGGTVIGEIALLGAYQIRTQDKTAVALLATLERAAEIDGVELAMPFAESETVLGTILVEGCQPLANPAYSGSCVNAQAPLARPYAMIGLADAWQMIRNSGLKLSPVHVGVNDTATWVGSGDFNHVGGPRAAGLVPEDLATAPADQGAATHGTKVALVVGADHRVGGVMGVGSVLGDKLKLTVADVFAGREPIWVPMPSVGGQRAPDAVVGRTQLVRDVERLLEQVRAGATIINCSFGLRPATVNDPNRDAIRRAIALEHEVIHRMLRRLFFAHPSVLVVAAAGNYNVPITTQNSLWGQRVANTITVGALDVRGQRADFSNHMGADRTLAISLAAPGCGILTGVMPDGKGHTDCGTSFSAPQVAGAAAVLRALKPDLTGDELKRILIETGASSVRSLDGHSNVSIPAEMGGKILRVDNAVLHVVNLVRADKGQTALTREQLLAMGGFTVTVAGGPEEYSFRVHAPDVGEVPTELKAELVAGKATLGGPALQTLTAPGEAAWTLRRTGTEKELLTVKVIRMPSEACSLVRVPYIESALGRLTNSTSISIKANVDFARPATPSTYDSGTILTTEIPVPKPAEGYTHTFAWAGALLTATLVGDNPSTSVTETITAEASADGRSLLWLELRREERAKQGLSWSTRETVVFLENLPLNETGTAFGLHLSGQEIVGMLGESSFRRTKAADGKTEEWVVMRCNSLTIEIRKAK